VYLDNLKLVLFAHMYAKRNQALGHFAIDPLVVRDPMFNYSKGAMHRFFTHPCLAFLLVWFCSEKKAVAFFDLKLQIKNSGNDANRMRTEMKQLEDVALRSLTKSQSGSALLSYIKTLQN